MKYRATKWSALVAAVRSTGATQLLAAEPSYEELLKENQELKEKLDASRAQPAFAR